MSPLVLTLMTFLAGALAVAGVYSVLSDLFLRDRTRLSRRVDQEFLKSQRERIQRSTLFKNLGTLAAEAAEDEPKQTLRQWFVALVEQSGMSLAPRRLLTIMAAAGLAAAALVGLLRQSPLPALAAGAAGAAAPFQDPSPFSRTGITLAAVTSPATNSAELDGRYCASWNAFRSAVVMVFRVAAVPIGSVPYRCVAP